MINQWAISLKAAGLNVEALDGWQMRAASSYVYEPVGIMLHHTASNRNSGNMPCRNIVVNGRKDLKGPLSQFLIGRNGDILLISGKRCNHAGRGMASRIEQLLADVEPPDYGQGLYDAPKPGAYRNGNKHFVGFELEADGLGERYSDELLEATITACAVLCILHGWNPLTRVLTHREWTSRKIDPDLRIPWRKLINDAVENGQFAVPEQAEAPPTQEIRIMRRGDIGPDVAAIQKVLGITADGHYGPVTELSVKRVQQKAKPPVTVDGIVGPITYALLIGKQKRPILKEWPKDVL